MIISMSTNILCLDSEMQETEFSEPSNKCVTDHIEWRCIYGSFGKEKGLHLVG